MSSKNPPLSQSEISKQYEEPVRWGQKVVLVIGQMTLDKLMGLAIIDDSKNLATQFYRACGEYIDRREADQTFSDQIDAARRRQEQRYSEPIFAPLGGRAMAFHAAIEQLEQQPETD